MSFDWMHKRLEKIASAKRHLRSLGILVSVKDREAPVAKYNVTGCNELLLDDSLVNMAERLGMKGE